MHEVNCFSKIKHQLKSLKKLSKLKESRMKGLLKTKAEINELAEKNLKRINPSNCWFLKKKIKSSQSNQSNKPLANLIRNKKLKASLWKIRNDREERAIETEEK